MNVWSELKVHLGRSPVLIHNSLVIMVLWKPSVCKWNGLYQAVCKKRRSQHIDILDSVFFLFSIFSAKAAGHTGRQIDARSGSVFRRNATHCISLYAIVVCVCVCVCVYAAFVHLRKTVSDRDVVFFKLCGMTPDITWKSLTQIGLQIQIWRTKWRPWNTIFGCNSAIY